MDFKINNKTYVIYVPEDKKDYLYLVNKNTGLREFRILYSQAETFFGENLKDIKDEKIGLEKKKGVLEPIKIERKPENVKSFRAKRVVAIWSNFKKRIMTPGALTEPERKNGIQENPNAGPAMNKLYDTIVSIQRKEPSITTYSEKWFGKTGDQKDSNVNYNLTQDILESMRLFTSFYTIGKRQYGAKDNPFKNANDYKDDEKVKKLKSLINKIKTASGANFKNGLDIMDGLQYYVGSDDGGRLSRIVYRKGGEGTVTAIGRNIEKGLPQREDGTKKFPFSLEKYKEIIQRAPALKDNIYFVKVKDGNVVKPKPYKDGQPYIPPAATATGASAGAKPQQESLKQKREKLLNEAIFKKLVR